MIRANELPEPGHLPAPLGQPRVRRTVIHEWECLPEPGPAAGDGSVAARTRVKWFVTKHHRASSRLPSAFTTSRVRKRLLIRVSVACSQVASSLDA